MGGASLQKKEREGALEENWGHVCMEKWHAEGGAHERIVLKWKDGSIRSCEEGGTREMAYGKVA